MEQVTAVAGLEHDVVEFLDGLQRTLVLHRVLVGILRLCTERTRGRNEALAADGCEHIVRLQSVLCHHIGLHPDAQGIGVTECHHVAHTGDTHQARFQVDVDIVGHEVVVVLAVNASDGSNLQDVALLLHHLHAHLGHIGRQQGRSTAHAVLHVYGSNVGVGALFEIDHDADIAR